MQRSFRILIALALFALVFGGGLWWRVRREPRLAFHTQPLKRGDLQTFINASGTIEPMEVVDVGAQVAGRIKSFGTDAQGKTVDFGSVVEKGAVLANIDDSVYAADLAVARAQVQQAQAGELSAAANLEQMRARLDQSGAEWKRTETLYASKLVAQVDYDTAQANFKVARSDVSVAQAGVAQAKATAVQAQAALERAQRNLDFCTIQSPVTGVIIDRRVNIGQTVVASLNAPSLFLIARDLTRMQIWASVNEADVGRIKVGGPVTFTCAALPGRRFIGKVDQVRLNATMTQNIVIYTVVVNTDNPDKLLLPYLTANVDFHVEQATNAWLVPNSALRWSPPSLAQVAPDARAQLPPDPPAGFRPGALAANAPSVKTGNDGTIWIKDGDWVRPVEVEAGISDGVTTAVASEGLHAGAEIVTGESAESGQPAVRNPFLPARRR